MKIYYIENLTNFNKIEQIYLIDTEGFGCIEFCLDTEYQDYYSEIYYKKIDEFKSCWKVNFDECAIMVRVL